jgi:hypothetical protein
VRHGLYSDEWHILEGAEEKHEQISKDSLYPDSELNREAAEYDARLLSV